MQAQWEQTRGGTHAGLDGARRLSSRRCKTTQIRAEENSALGSHYDEALWRVCARAGSKGQICQRIPLWLLFFFFQLL